MKSSTSLRHVVAALTALMLVLCGLGGLMLWALDRSDSELSALVKEKWRAMHDAGELADLSVQNARLTVAALMPSHPDAGELMAEHQRNSERITKLLVDLKPLLDGVSRNLYDSIVSNREQYVRSRVQMMEALSARHDIGRARELFLTETWPLLTTHYHSIRRLVEAVEQSMSESASKTVKHIRRLRMAATLLFGAAMVLSAGIAAITVVKQKQDERQRLEAAQALKDANDSLEGRVLQRTCELESTNRSLKEANLQLVRALEEKRAVASTLHATQEEAHRLYMALNQASDIVVIADPEGIVQYVNPTVEAAAGYRREEVIGQHVGAFRAPARTNGTSSDFWDAVRSGKPWRGRMDFRKKDGTTIFGELCAYPVWEMGKLVNIVVVIRDLTRELGLEHQLMQAQKLEAVGRLAAGVAHEINTPTQYVYDNVHFLWDSLGDIKRVLDRVSVEIADSNEPEAARLERLGATLGDAEISFALQEIPRATEQALEGLSRISKIVGAMKDFSHPGTEERKAFDVNRAIESTVTISRNEWKYVAEMETDLDRDLPLVPIIVSEMNQVFLNLIVNAAHAIGEATNGGNSRRGRIKVQTRRVDNFAEIRISDDGAGIPAAIRPRIFEQFFTTKPVGKGTGQGLSLSRGIVVDRHHGRLTFESEEGRGTTFIIQLPLAADQRLDEVAA